MAYMQDAELDGLLDWMKSAAATVKKDVSGFFSPTSAKTPIKLVTTGANQQPVQLAVNIPNITLPGVGTPPLAPATSIPTPRPKPLAPAVPPLQTALTKSPSAPSYPGQTTPAQLLSNQASAAVSASLPGEAPMPVAAGSPVNPSAYLSPAVPPSQGVPPLVPSGFPYPTTQAPQATAVIPPGKGPTPAPSWLMPAVIAGGGLLIVMLMKAK